MTNVNVKQSAKIAGLYRNTKLYKAMTSYHACELAEGFGEGEGADTDSILTAWQWLHDTKTAYSLQGFYGRACRDLIESGSIAK